MSLWTISEIKNALGDQLIRAPEDNITINEVVIDSRKKTSQGLFVALIGPNNDGHNFIDSAFENGAVCALVEKNLPDARTILVKNTEEALRRLALAARQRFQGRVVAVTGSVGKTSVKEMLRTVLAAQSPNKTHGTIGNFNNHFGLPLTLANLPADYDFTVLEMGMNHANEITPLSKMARPHIAVITTVNSAHIVNFANEEEIARAKAEIFAGLEPDGYAIINADNVHYKFLKKTATDYYKINAENIISFGENNSDANILLVEKNLKNENIEVKVETRGTNKSAASTSINYQINGLNQTVAFNSLIAIATLFVLSAQQSLAGETTQKSLQALAHLQTPKGRGNLLKINHNNRRLTIIDDSYNANLASMRAGLRFLADLGKQHPQSRTVAAIGDMLELGDHAQKDHRALAEDILKCEIDVVFLVGPLMTNLVGALAKKSYRGEVLHYQNSDELAAVVTDLLKQDDILLVKASRGTRMEKIIEKIV